MGAFVVFQRFRSSSELMRSVPSRSHAAEEETRADAKGSRPGDIHALTEALVRAFDIHHHAQKAKPKLHPPSPEAVRKSIKIGVAAGLAIILGWKPLLATLSTSSAEAFVNTSVVTLRAPIDGKVENFTSKMQLGASVDAHDELFRISEPLADRTRVLDVQHALSRARQDYLTIQKRISVLGRLKANLDKQAEAFRLNRILQTRERIGELEEKINAAVAVQREASTGVARNTRLDAAGLARDGGLARAIRDETVATRTIGELKHQAAALHVELNALNARQFVGDSFNDRPQSAQRSEQLQQTIAELTIDLDSKTAEIARLRADLKAEKGRFALLAATMIHAPNVGVVWEILTSPGERVVRGQVLMRMLDCSQSIVSAAVEESVYNRIHVGDPVTFRLRGETIDRPGKIVRMSGLAAAPSNLAISPNSLLKAPYRAAISVPSLGQNHNCLIGRTGKVTFEVGTHGKPASPATP
ncbi:MAG: HlyD family secretion protein [Hyphomicrobiaceae bacterium]